MTTASNAQIIANLVVLSRAADKARTALLVGGDKDGRFYRKITDPERCRPFAAGNRACAELTLKILKAQGEKGVVAIVDADTDHIEGKTSTDPDLLLTHTRDAEGIILQTSALSEVLIEFDLEGCFGPEPALATARAIAPIALLKFAAKLNGWQVRTSELDFRAFVNPANLACNEAQLCKHMEELTITPKVAAADYQRELAARSAANHDPFRVARGHDATELLAWAIVQRRGKKKKEGALTTSGIIESYLRAAYRHESFKGCALQKLLEAWESRNIPYKVLRR